MVKNFLSLFSRSQEHTNPTILIDAKQWALTPLLFVLSGWALRLFHTSFSLWSLSSTKSCFSAFFFTMICEPTEEKNSSNKF